MTEVPLIQITFGPADPDLDEDQRLHFSQRLLLDVQELDEVHRAERAENLNPDAGMKGFETLIGFLTAEVTLPNLKEFAGWMGDRFSDQPMTVKVKVGEQEVELEARSGKELREIEAIAHSLLAKMTANQPPGSREATENIQE